MATNAERSRQTRGRLVAEARLLFARDGFAGTSTEAILARAEVKRGALYHHFADKAALFQAVCVEISEEAGRAIEAAVAKHRSPLPALERGSEAWVAFVTDPAVSRIVLVDAPTVLGWQRWQALDLHLGYQSLRDGIQVALDQGAIRFDGGAEMLAVMANGALNALALHIVSADVPPATRAWRTAARGFWRAFAAS